MRKHKIRGADLLILLLFLAGLSLVLYPSVSNAWNSYHQSQAIVSYAQGASGLDPALKAQLWQRAQDYNQRLVAQGPHWFLTEEEQADYESQLALDDSGIMGYVEIPKIAVSLPIYHGCGEGVLSKGLGHIEGSTLPVGGEGMHCVLSGHRGLPSDKLLTDLDRLELGDRFSLYVLEEELCYQVDQILVVEPDQLTELEPQAGQDLCTLVTCTPYGVNSHRLLVRGHRVPTNEREGSAHENS